MRKFGIVVAAALLLPLAQAAPKAKNYFVFVGTYTNDTKSKGIYVYRFTPATGAITEIGLAAETVSPSFLATDPKGRFVYAVNEVNEYQGQKAGSVSAFAIDQKSGKLTPLNTVSTKSPGPCHLMVDKTSKALLVANYAGGSVAAFPIGADGKLGESSSFDQHTGSSVDGKRQTAPHAHCTNISPNNKYAMVNDLGLDKVFVYKLDAAGSRISPNSPATVSIKPGSGPRHFAFHPNNHNAYVINEMASTVTAFQYDAAKGALQEIQTISTLPADFKGESTTAEVFVHPSGKFLYGSNRGHDSIAVFSIDGAGKLTLVENTPTQGSIPRGFAIDPTGKYLFAGNQKSDNVVVFAIDPASGKLKPTGEKLSVGSPVSVIFVAAK